MSRGVPAPDLTLDGLPEIRQRIASALAISPAAVTVDRHRYSPSGLMRQCTGSACGKRFFAKIFLADPYPVPDRFRAPWVQPFATDDRVRSIEDQIAVEWEMTQRMRSLARAAWVPAPLGRSPAARTIVWEEIRGVGVGQMARRTWRAGSKAEDGAEALFDAGQWLRRVHEASSHARQTVDVLQAISLLEEACEEKSEPGQRYVSMALETLRNSVREVGTATFEVPVALTHGDFCLSNLLWDPENRRLSVIDFELSWDRPVCHDLFSIVSDLQGHLLNPMVPKNVMRAWEQSFWNGYGEVSPEMKIFVRAFALSRIFYDQLPRLLTRRERRGWVAGINASLYRALLEQHVVSRRLGTPREVAQAAVSAFDPARIDGEPETDAIESMATKQADLKRMGIGAGVALGGRMLGRMIRLGVDIVLAHVLGPATFGLYVIGWTIMRVLTAVSPLGLDAGVIRFGSPNWRRDESKLKGVLTQSLRYSLLSGLLAGLGFYLAAPWLSTAVFHHRQLLPVFDWFALAIPLATCLKVASAATRVSQRMQFSAYAEELCQPATALVLVTAFFLLGYRLIGAVAAVVISIGCALILALFYVKRLFPLVTSKNLKAKFSGKELFRFSLPASLSATFAMLLLWVDRLFVGSFRSSGEAGIYHAASQLAIALAIILSAFGAIVYPMFADLYHRGKRERLEELFRVSTKWSLYLSLPAFLVMCFVPRQTISVIFGGPYLAGWKVLPILGAGQLINAGTGPVAELLTMSGYQNRISALTGGALVANILAALFLVPRWGMLGAAWGTAGAIGGLSLLSILMARVTLKVWPYDRRHVKGIMAAALAAGALWLLRQIQFSSPAVTLAASIVISLFVFLGALILFGLDREDREFLEMIIERTGARVKA